MDQLELRNRIMGELERVFLEHGFLTRDYLSNFKLENDSYRLIDSNRGIWNPRYLDSTLTIISDPSGPYHDAFRPDGLLEYAYQVGNPDGINRKMRIAMENRDPIILPTKIAPGVFTPTMPVFVVGDMQKERKFLLAVDESLALMADTHSDVTPLQRRYAETTARRRLHQPEFRGRVMRAYKTRCAICSLAHGSLLDAAHIIPDSHELGHPEVSNGIAMCKIHHTAYDQNIIGITPEYLVQVSPSFLSEKDGPMLKHGIQEMHGKVISTPQKLSDKPNKESLSIRFREFKLAI